MVKILKATKQDLDQVCQLFDDYNKELEKYFPKDQLKVLQKLHAEEDYNLQRRRNIAKTIRDKKQLFLVAKENEKIIACIIGWVNRERVGKFDQLVLSKQSKKKEILDQLYKELEKWFKAKKCSYVVVNVIKKNPRKKLYKNFGFDVVLEEMRKVI